MMSIKSSYIALLMTVDKKLASAGLIILLLTGCSSGPLSIDLGPALSRVTNCTNLGAGCPDSLFLAADAVSVLDYDLSSWYNCLEREGVLSQPSTAIQVNRTVSVSIPTSIPNRNLYSYKYDKGWKPLHVASRKRLFISYSEAYSYDNKAIVFLTTYASGRDIDVDVCVYEISGKTAHFDDCYFSINPF